MSSDLLVDDIVTKKNSAVFERIISPMRRCDYTDSQNNNNDDTSCVFVSELNSNSFTAVYQ